MDLNIIEKPIIVDNILHQNDNLKILKHLLQHGHFALDRSPIKNKIYNSQIDLLLYCPVPSPGSTHPVGVQSHVEGAQLA